MKKSKLELSAAEWEIMHVIWKADEPVTVRSVIKAAYPDSEKAYTTVQTFMNILVDKGFLGRRKENRVNLYWPKKSLEEVLQGSLSGVAQRMFQGSFGAMASFLVNSVKLKPEELKELRQLLNSKGRE